MLMNGVKRMVHNFDDGTIVLHTPRRHRGIDRRRGVG
jgi:hypothetical protein